MSIELDDELNKLVLYQSSISYMKTIQSKFDDHFVYDHCKGRIGFGPDVKMRTGKVNKGVFRFTVNIKIQILSYLISYFYVTIICRLSHSMA
jgi:hypothetical protein